MAKPYLISDEAFASIDEIIQNVVDYTSYTSSGIKLYNELFEKFELISLLPRSGKLRADGTREIFARSYRIVYQELDDHIRIIAVIHARRLYPRSA